MQNKVVIFFLKKKLTILICFGVLFSIQGLREHIRLPFANQASDPLLFQGYSREKTSADLPPITPKSNYSSLTLAFWARCMIYIYSYSHGHTTISWGFPRSENSYRLTY